MKYTPEIVVQIIKYIEAGNYVKTACQAVGLHRDTFYEWKKDETKSDISDTIIQKAKARAIVRNVMIIQKAAAYTWTAAAWFLERRQHKDWGRKEHLELKDTTPRIITFKYESDNGESDNGNGSKTAEDNDKGNKDFQLVIRKPEED